MAHIAGQRCLDMFKTTLLYIDFKLVFDFRFCCREDGVGRQIDQQQTNILTNARLKHADRFQRVWGRVLAMISESRLLRFLHLDSYNSPDANANGES